MIFLVNENSVLTHQTSCDGKFLFPGNSKLATSYSTRRFNQQYESENIQIQLISIYAGRFYLLTHITKLMLLNYKHVYK